MNISILKVKGIKHFALVVLACITSSCASVYSTKSSSLDFNSARENDQRYSNDLFRESEVAEVAYRENRWADAARHYQSLTKQVPNDAYIWFRLANTYVNNGNFDEAIKAYQVSIERDSTQAKPWFNLSTAYLLNAKIAMMQSLENLRDQDPARTIISDRVLAIDKLMGASVESFN